MVVVVLVVDDLGSCCVGMHDMFAASYLKILAPSVGKSRCNRAELSRDVTV